MTREELFQKALQDHKAKKERDSSKGSFDSDYPELEWTALNGVDSSIDKIVRFVGNFPTIRESSTDAKLIEFSKIKSDNDKTFYCIWPSAEDNPNWILRRVHDLVMSYTWNKEEAKKEFLNAAKCPELFKRVSKNSSENKFASGWKPKPVLISNIIDRHDMAWHKEQGKTKLLSKGSWEIQGSDSMGFEFGVPGYLYNTIFDNIVEYSGWWDLYDIAIRRSKENPWYFAFHGEDDLKKISDASKDSIIVGELTEEERSWERTDIDKITNVTRYQKIKKNLGVLFQEVDLKFGKKFFEELCDLAEKEKAEYEKSKSKPVTEGVKDNKKDNEKDEKEEDEVPIPPEDDEDTIEDSRPLPKANRRTTKKQDASEIDWEGLADGSYNGTQYLGVNKLSDKEKSMIKSINEDGSFVYVVDGKTLETEDDGLLSEESSGFLTPEEFSLCPLTGLLFT